MQDGPDDAALDEIAHVVVAQRPVPRQQIACRVILAPDGIRRRHAGEPAELVFAQNLDRRGRLLRVELLGPDELLAATARYVARSGKPFGTHHEHRRLRVDVFVRRAAEARDECVRVLAAERTQLAGENDNLSFKWLM